MRHLCELDRKRSTTAVRFDCEPRAIAALAAALSFQGGPFRVLVVPMRCIPEWHGSPHWRDRIIGLTQTAS